MKKILILFFIFICIGFFAKIPEYNDLNNIIIIDKIVVKCNNNKYDLSFREVKPVKKDNGLFYKYNYYYETIDNIDRITELNQKKYHNNLYYDKAKYSYKNCNNN